MSWGYYGRTPEEVQGDNGRNFTFEKVRDLYENTKPIKGKRECLNIRPIGDRNRCHERVVKVSDNEYYLTCNSWATVSKNGEKVDDHCRALTFTKDRWGNGENLIIHTPRTSRGNLAGHWLSAPSMYYFYHYKLPDGFKMHNHKGKKYVVHDSKFYPLHLGDLVFMKNQDNPNYRPLQVHREYKRELDKEQTKQLREQIKPLVNYIHTMIDIVENEKYKHGNPLKDIPTSALFKQDPDESWFELVEIYKQVIREEKWHYFYESKHNSHEIVYRKDLLNSKIHNHLYRKVKPFKIYEVPIGSLCYDKYKNWE